jgi:hypothetical protein
VPAVISLVFGALGCIPYVAGIVAIILGIVGLRQAKRPEVARGSGLAIAGIILGALSVGFWLLLGGSALAFFGGTSAQREVGRTFIRNLSEGKVEAAVAQTDGSIATADVKELSETVQSWGALTDVRAHSIDVDFAAGRTELGGTATFDKTSKSFQAVLVKSGTGWKVNGIHFN